MAEPGLSKRWEPSQKHCYPAIRQRWSWSVVNFPLQRYDMLAMHTMHYASHFAQFRIRKSTRRQKSVLEIGMLMVDFALLYAPVNWVLRTDAGMLNGIIYMTLTFLNPKEISRVIFIGFYQSLIRHAKICQPSSLHLLSTVQSWQIRIFRLLRVSQSPPLILSPHPLQSYIVSIRMVGWDSDVLSLSINQK